MPGTVDAYTAMQKNYYEHETPRMAIDNHRQHNDNPDYWTVLLAPLNDGDWTEKMVLDFGCGCGRSVQNILNNYDVKEIHGCDISSNNIAYCYEKTPEFVTTGKTNYKFITVDGQSLHPLESDTYDLIFSTIVLQHICVYTIRKSILTDMFRCLKPGGMISIQMGYGPGKINPAGYYDDAVTASGTNGLHDVKVDSPDQIQKDLEEIGFINFDHSIRGQWVDGHKNWIYFTATKP